MELDRCRLRRVDTTQNDIISKDFSGKGFWDRIHILAKALRIVFEPIEATAMTPEEYESGDSMIALFAREGEVVMNDE